MNNLFPTIVIGLDVLLDEFVELLDLSFEGLDHFPDAFLDFEVASHWSTVGFLGEHIDELSTSGDQFGEGFDFGRFRRPRGWLDHFAKLGQQIGVDGIGFSELSQTAGEITDLPGIDHHGIVTGLDQFGGEGAFITSGGFEDELGDGEFLQIVEEFLMPRAGVGVVGFDSCGPGGDLERIFGDINSNVESFVRHGKVPFLQMRANRTYWPASLSAVRVCPMGTTRTTLRDGLGDQGTIGLTPSGAADSACFAPLCAGLRCARLADGNLTHGNMNHV